MPRETAELLAPMPGVDEPDMPVLGVQREAERRRLEAVEPKGPQTRYDWAEGRRGELLLPEHGGSIPSCVSVDITSIHDVFAILYREGRLTGRALEDARRKYGGGA